MSSPRGEFSSYSTPRPPPAASVTENDVLLPVEQLELRRRLRDVESAKADVEVEFDRMRSLVDRAYASVSPERTPRSVRTPEVPVEPSLDAAELIEREAQQRRWEEQEIGRRAKVLEAFEAEEREAWEAEELERQARLKELWDAEEAELRRAATLRWEAEEARRRAVEEEERATRQLQAALARQQQAQEEEKRQAAVRGRGRIRHSNLPPAPIPPSCHLSSPIMVLLCYPLPVSSARAGSRASSCVVRWRRSAGRWSSRTRGWRARQHGGAPQRTSNPRMICWPGLLLTRCSCGPIIRAGAGRSMRRCGGRL